MDSSCTCAPEICSRTSSSSTARATLKSGRPSVSYEGDGTDFLRGCLASANEVDKAHGTADHIITHVIVQRGKPRAERTDRLILGNRVFYIVDIDDTRLARSFDSVLRRGKD